MTTQFKTNWLAKVKAMGECLNITYKAIWMRPNIDTDKPIQVPLLICSFSSSFGNFGTFIFRIVIEMRRIPSMKKIPGPGPKELKQEK